MERLATWLSQPMAQTAVGVVALLLAILLAALISRRVFARGMNALARRTAWTWDDALVAHHLPKRLARIAPTLVAQFGIVLVPGLPEDIVTLVRNVALALTVLFTTFAAGALLDAFEDVVRRRSDGKRSVKSLTQLVKMAAYIFGTVVVVALLIDRSPLILLSGLGALSAILLLVFKDTILGFVAGLQLTLNDMLRVGDWIEMPSAGADGDVVDIALHTVKVRNWDKTITTIPTWKLISESFKNWRGMSESGARRIMRSLRIDAAGVRFLDEAAIARLSRLRHLHEYLEGKRVELDESNRTLGEAARTTGNLRRLTNLGTFRAYAERYLRAHPGIHQGATLIVRQLAATSEGVPIELYCFTGTTDWIRYENIQADIFDHLIAILPEFGLSLFQHPAGSDLRTGLKAQAASA